MTGRQPPAQLFAGKGALHARLRIVKIAAYRIYGYVFPFLRNHLQALHLAGAVAGVEHRYFDARQPGKACQRRLPVSPEVATRISVVRVSPNMRFASTSSRGIS